LFGVEGVKVRKNWCASVLVCLPANKAGWCAPFDKLRERLNPRAELIEACC